MVVTIIDTGPLVKPIGFESFIADWCALRALYLGVQHPAYCRCHDAHGWLECGESKEQGKSCIHVNSEVYPEGKLQCFGRGQSMCIAEILDMILVVILETMENKAREFSEVCQKH